MARLLLSDAHDWQLSFPDEQDVRGFRVLDAGRNDTGRIVDDMVVDTDAERVSHVVFSDGTHYPAEALSIGDGVVYATTETVDDARRTADIPSYGRVGRRSDATTGALATLDDDTSYQAHYDTTYSATGRPYDVYRPAYEHGRQACATYGARAYAEVEPDVRRDYESRHGGDADGAWQHVKDAVRHAYERARAALA